MDGQRFDELARRLASGISRRQLLRGLIGTAAAGIITSQARQRASAAPPPGCNAFCNSVPPGRQRGQCHHDCAQGGTTGLFADCGGNTANLCSGPTGTICCQSGQSCCGGACLGPCTALDACHVAGQCDPNAGQCTNPPAAAGTPCGAGPSCGGGTSTAQATCDGNGTCAPGATISCAPYVCGATACLTACATDSDCVAGAYCDGGQCLPDHGTGQACTANDQCTSGFCVGGICCDTACADQCQSCDSGRCTPIAGCCTADSQCDDGNACTDDRCVNNVCVHTPRSGCCTADADCDDGNPCTHDTCCLSPACGKKLHSCAHTRIAGCCTANGPSDQCDDLNPCTIDSCDTATNSCVHTPVNCPGCFACNSNPASPDAGQCIFDTCREANPCQLCNGSSCVADTSLNGQLACNVHSEFCLDGQCVSCLPVGTACLQNIQCCSGSCSDFTHTCQCLVAGTTGCRSSADCCGAVIPGCCSGTCLALDVDLNNCGACRVAVPAGGVCSNGVPTCTAGFHNDNGRCCPAGSSNCGSACANTSSDPLNCGSCGRACDIGHPFCVSGKCCDIIGDCT